MQENEGYIPPEAESFKTPEIGSPKEVSFGETVKPFEDFNDKYRIEFDHVLQAEVAQVETTFKTENFEWVAHLSDTQQEEIVRDNPEEEVLLVLPDGEKFIPQKDIPKYREQLEARLLDPAIFVHWKEEEPPLLESTFILPSGTQLKGIMDEDEKSLLWFEDKDGKKFNTFYIPAVENVVSRLQVRLDKI